MSEVRPWINAHVSIGHFETTQDLSLMDCKWEKGLSSDYLVDAQGAELDWRFISEAFSVPVPDTESADYKPTQVLPDMIEQMGCDGIKYRSLLGADGNNFALFDLKSAKLVR